MALTQITTDVVTGNVLASATNSYFANTQNGGVIPGNFITPYTLPANAHANNSITFSQLSVGAPYWNSSNVGIGTTSPLFVLDVQGPTGTNIPFSVKNTTAANTTPFSNLVGRFAANTSGADATINLTDAVTYNAFIGMGSGHLYFGTNGFVERMRIANTGNVGIGITNPIYSLHVKNPNDYRAALFQTGSTYGPSIQIQGSKIYELRSTDTGAGEGAGLFFIYDKDNNTSRLTVNSSGQIGINTNSPSQTLTVNGNISATTYYGNLGSNVYTTYANTNVSSAATLVTLTSGTSWTVPSNVYHIDVLIIGGGGGGGANLAGGGGGGQVVFVSKMAVTPGAGISYSIGAGGGGGTNSTSNAGGGGGSTTFNGITAVGGGGGGGGDNGGGGTGGNGSNNGSQGEKINASGGGIISDITGVGVTYASGGGGGGAYSNVNSSYYPPGTGGPGAGNGGWGTNTLGWGPGAGGNATWYGCGGGGGGLELDAGGSGYQGAVIIRYVAGI